MFIIRDATPNDWTAICRVHDRARPDELRGSFDARAFIPLAEDPESEELASCDVFVAELEGEVVGFAGIDDPYFAWLYVDPACYRRGIGRALLEHSLARLSDDAWTIACGNNHPAIALYLRAGFVIESRSIGTNAGYDGPSARLALHPERRGWTQPKKSAAADMAGDLPSLPQLPETAAQEICTARLEQTPMLRAHAAALFPVLDDEALHEFTGGAPPASVETLAALYARRETRRSPDGKQLWLNWLLRRRDDGRALGFTQATVHPGRAYVAWVVGTSNQGQGYATEAAAALVRWLTQTLGVPEVRACVHPEHGASQRVAQHAGLHRTPAIEDGEEVWVHRPPKERKMDYPP